MGIVFCFQLKLEKYIENNTLIHNIVSNYKNSYKLFLYFVYMNFDLSWSYTMPVVTTIIFTLSLTLPNKNKITLYITSILQLHILNPGSVKSIQSTRMDSRKGGAYSIAYPII